VGVKAQLDMERRDTLYMSIGGRLGLLARVGVRGEVTLFAEWQQHNGASRVSSSGITLGGAELRLRRTDSPLFPRRGYDARVAAALGSRRLDEGLSTLAELGLDAWQYVPMGSRISLAVRLTGEAKPLLSAAPSLLQSEQYTIGGAGILRGFAERSVFASSYAMVTVEPRYFVGAQGYLHAFYDVAACDRDWLHGFGVGAKLAAAAGIFSISVALGGQLGGSIAPANAKVHVGYVAVF
jgi:hemolysin activation/secretion protein